MSKQQIGLSECDITFDYKNITFLRVLATIGIFILHEGTKHNLTTIVSMMGFAVPMFFYMSAIIYGTRELNYFDDTFLKKRLRSLSNIYLPYVISVSLLLIFALHYPVLQVFKQTAIDLLFLNGLFPSIIPMCGHLWFLSYLLIFYGLLMISSKLILQNNKYRYAITCLMIVLFVGNVCFLHKAKIYYVLGYLLLFLYSKNILYTISRNNLVRNLCLLVGIALLIMPLFFPIGQNGNLTGCMSAVLLLFGTYRKILPPPLFVKFSKISMAFYLCHHIFVYVLDSILLTFVLTIVFSVVFTYFLNLNKIVKWLLSK